MTAEPLAWLGGRILPEREAALPVRDLSVRLGVGAFETVLVRAGRAVFLEDHLARLRGAARLLGIEPPAGMDARGAVHALLQAWGACDGALRLQLTAGLPPELPPALLVTVGPPRPLSPGARERGVAVRIAPRERFPQPAGPLAGAKTTSYADRHLARRWAEEEGAYDAVLLDAGGCVAEGARASIFWVRGGRLHTAPLESDILRGTTRARLLAIARDAGVPLEEGRFPPGDLLASDEALLASALALVLPVASVDGRPLPASPGPLTRLLAERLETEVARGLARTEDPS